jgi:hypothetical protein
MATKSINTRIKNKIASISDWVASTGTLLDGEIAVVRVPTGDTYTNPVTGKAEPVIELLMKVGDGTSAFDALPWLSAKASDVYNWAKTEKATDIPVTVDGTSSTLGAYLTKVNTNASNITTVSNKVDVAKVSTAIADAINKLDFTAPSASGNTTSFIDSVSQTDGKISATKKTITPASASAAGIVKLGATGGAAKHDDFVTLKDTTVPAVASRVSAVEGKLDGVTKVTDSITAAINALDSTSSGSGSFVTNVTQTNGVVAVTKGNLPTASASTAGIAKLGATGGAATYDAVSSLTTQVNTNKSDIANLKTAVAGGVHFRGTAKAAPSSTTVTMSDDTTLTAAAGDVVIYSGKEYIYTGTAWEELGDVTRIGNLETKINGLDYDGGSFGTSKFVTKVTQSDGKIAVSYGQPASTDVTHSSTTVSATLDDHAARVAAVEGKLDGVTKVTTSITNAINGLDVSEPNASGTSTSFIATAKQENGKIVVTKKSLPTASATTAGITMLGATGGAATYDRAEAINTSLAGVDSRVTAVEGKLEGVTKVTTSITNAIGALDFTDPTASGTTTQFIASVSQTDGKISATKKTITSASTSTPGIVQLSSSTSSSSETLAATPKAVKTAYDKGNDAQTRVAAVEGNYVRFASNKLYVGKTGADEIIFDCGGAPTA